jgi:hypothetical protein
MTEPTLSPLAALTRLRESGDFKLDGLSYTLDGPMMSPGRFHYPVVEDTDEKGAWYPSGELDEEIGEDSKWVYFAY